ncbi:MAG: hypothetical protein Q9215_003485 [Flavoplaca cf. flavocitrina]
MANKAANIVDKRPKIKDSIDSVAHTQANKQPEGEDPIDLNIPSSAQELEPESIDVDVPVAEPGVKLGYRIRTSTWDSVTSNKEGDTEIKPIGASGNTLRFFLVYVVCLVGSIYLRFNPRQQNLQVDIDPGHNNATASNIPEATGISSGVDLGSQARQHPDPPVLGTVDGSTRDQAPAATGTRHGAPTAPAQSQCNRSNLMDL